jgi:hypothetical protein
MKNIYFLPIWFALQTTFITGSKNRLSRLLAVLLFSSASINFYGQSTIQGKVTDKKGVPVAFANVFLKSTMEGTSSDTLGLFSFTTAATDSQVVVVALVGYSELTQLLVLKNEAYQLNFKLREADNTLNEIVINAGTMDATNERAVAVLRPLDIVTTAGAMNMGLAGAIQTLPGVQRNGGDQTGLFVRGGDASETSFIVDGLTVQNAFMSGPPGVGQRSRFNPFQFKGTSFSTGGYSARYGQALSSVIDLQTNDLPEKTTLSAGLNFAGVNASGTKLMENSAIEFTGFYLNFSPYYGTAQTNYNFARVPQGTGFSARFVTRLSDKDYFKMGVTYGVMQSGIEIPDPNAPQNTTRFDTRNENLLFNTSYTHFLNEKLRSFTSLSFSNNTDKNQWSAYRQHNNDTRLQGRTELKYYGSGRFSLLGGVEVQQYAYTQYFDTTFLAFDELLSAAYLEAEYKPARWFAVKPGIRGEYSQVIGQANLSPRLSLAFKTGQNSQVSMASGLFYQTPQSNYLLFGYRPGFQQAAHYMANYQWTMSDRTFRLEGYYKSYSQLIREHYSSGTFYTPNPYRFYFNPLPERIDNSGSGYAQGIDLFWRDKALLKNFDYWISYSYVDTRRLYQNYAASSTPDYVSNHNLSIVAKYMIEKIKTNISATYSYASGRPYYDPAASDFFGSKAPDYNNLALTISYVTPIKKMFAVFYFGVDNLTNTKNVLGYRYSPNGQYKSPILPPLYRTFFLGVNLSISPFKKDEL